MFASKKAGRAAAPADPNFPNVALLLNGNGTNGAQNNTFLDSSTNNRTITRSGNTTQGSFSAYGANWSVNFDGTGDLLSTNAAALAPGTGDFCIEYWVNAAVVATVQPIFNLAPTNTFGAFGVLVRIEAGNSFRLYVGNGTAWVLQGVDVGQLATYPVLGRWQHHALTRSGSTLRYFINGVQTYTATNTTDLTQQWLRIGEYAGVTWNGLISNFRLVRGSPVYTAAFTPPTTPLTPISGTALLTCNTNRIADASTNNLTITRAGDVRVQDFSPFAPTSAYTPAIAGGSMYFDGTGDGLAVTATGSAFGTGNFTIECWFYRTGSGTDENIFSQGSAGAGGYGIALLGLQIRVRTPTITDNSRLTGNIATRGEWNHIALVRSGTTTTLYFNGVSTLTITSDTSNQTATAWNIGNYGGATFVFNGYISGMRVLTGAALYTATFTPPTAPPTAIANTSLLINATNAGIVDSAAQNVIETVGTAQVSTVTSRFGTGSILFSGTAGNYLTAPSSPVYDFGTGNFTIEMWANFSNASGTWQTLLSRAYAITGGWRLYKSENATELRWYRGSTDTVLTSGANLTNGVWTHIAVVKNGTTITIYVNGTARGSASDGGYNYSPGVYALEIGQGVVTSTFPFNGYLDEVRITRGIARYVANFTPPALPFPDQ
jgi:hypothetical protein